MIHREPRRRVEWISSAWVASAALVWVACGGVVGDVDGDAGASASSSEAGTSHGDGFDPPTPPDLGAGAVVCGEPGESIGTDEEVALLAGCEVFQGTIIIPYPHVGDLSPLASLRVIVTGLTGNRGADPYTLEGLNQLEWVGKFYFSDGLNDLSAMGNLVGVEHFVQFLGAGLTDCRGLEHLRSVGGDLNFVANRELSSLDGLSGLEWIGGNLKIEANRKLDSLSGLSSLRQVDGNVTFQVNESLPPAEIDALLSRIEVGGEILRN